MLELNVTKFVATEERTDYSASVMEMGPNAAQLIWANCERAVEDYQEQLFEQVEKDELLSEIRDHFAEYGAWTREEIDGWSETDCLAILIQEIAASMGELEGMFKEKFIDEVTESEFNEVAEQGRISSRLFFVDSKENGREWFLTLGM